MRGPLAVRRGACRPDLLALFLAAAAFAGCERLEVTVVTAGVGPVESTVTSVEAGIVEPLHKASLAPPVSGRIVRIHCAEGDRVQAGQSLVELENDIERLRMAETASDLKRLKDMGPLATEEQIEKAQFLHERARIDYERTFVRATFTGFVAELNARLGEMTFGSFGFAATGSLGAQEPLVYLIDDSKLFVEAEIDESDVFRLRMGQDAQVTMGGNEKRKYRGRVVYMDPVVSTREGESRTAKVKVELTRPELPGAAVDALGTAAAPPGNGGMDHGGWGGILVGMSADIEILVDRAEAVPRVSTAVILERGEDKHIFVVEGDQIRRRKVVTGIGNWEWTEVKEGVQPGDRVVIPTESKVLEEGRRVKVKTGESPAAGR